MICGVDSKKTSNSITISTKCFLIIFLEVNFEVFLFVVNFEDYHSKSFNNIECDEEF